MKKSSLSAKEKEFILAKADTLSPSQIALKLDRGPEQIRKFIDRNHVPKGAPLDDRARTIVARTELRNSELWARLKDELTNEELKYFEEQYARLEAQFNNDVRATEQSQIFQAIKFDILMQRNMGARKQSLRDIERLEKMRDDFLSTRQGSIEKDDRQYIIEIEAQIAGHRSAESNRTTEYTRLHAEWARLLKDLKATREQRIMVATDNKTSFLGLLKALQLREVAEREGRSAELMALAAENEVGRLSEPHKYADGNEDLPILNEDSVE